MQYRALGHSGLRVSALSYGAWLTVSESGFVPLETHLEILRTALRRGVNFIDNAESYGAYVGESEVLMGQALQRLFQEGLRRSELVVSTKIFQGGDTVNARGLSRKHLVEGLRASLQRLQLDYAPRRRCMETRGFKWVFYGSLRFLILFHAVPFDFRGVRMDFMLDSA